VNSFITPQKISTMVTEQVIYYNDSLEKEKDKIRYGLEWAISTFIQFGVVIVFSIPFGLYIESLIFLFIGGILRMFSGGAHLSSYYLCLTITSIQAVLYPILIQILLLYLYNNIIIIPLYLISFLLLLLYAPKIYIKRKIIKRKNYIFFKIASLLLFLIITLSTFALNLTPMLQLTIIISVFVQSLTLTLFMERFFNKISIMLMKGGY
jgi:accessory gene regulator B